jgi:hypothetical protein
MALSINYCYVQNIQELQIIRVLWLYPSTSLMPRVYVGYSLLTFHFSSHANTAVWIYLQVWWISYEAPLLSYIVINKIQ